MKMARTYRGMFTKHTITQKKRMGKNYPFGLILNANFSFRSLEELFANHARQRQCSARHICPTPSSVGRREG